MRPFLKWPGNKYRVLKHLHEVLPAGERLIEPFAGSAAVSISTDYPQYLLAEINHDLINLYQTLQSEGEKFIKYCRRYFCAENNEEKQYYQIREKFNQTKNSRQRSAMFIYLNKHGYNGLCRYNSSGLFNVPFGRYDKVTFPEKEMQHFYQKTLQAEFMHADYLTTMSKARPGDVVYCDPPYVPLSDTAYFTRYAQQDFDLDMQIELAKQAKQLASKGIPVIISNHDTDFTREHYKQAEVISFPVPRFISCDGKNRKPVQELLAIFQ